MGWLVVSGDSSILRVDRSLVVEVGFYLGSHIKCLSSRGCDVVWCDVDVVVVVVVVVGRKMRKKEEEEKEEISGRGGGFRPL